MIDCHLINFDIWVILCWL